MPGRGRRQLQHRERRRGHAQQPFRSLADSVGQQPRRRCGRQHRHRPRVRHRRRNGAQAGPAHDPESLRQLDDVRRQLAPSVVGLRAGQDQQVAVTDPRRRQTQVGPVEPHRLAIDDVEDRPPGPVVVDRVGIEGGDRRAALGELSGGRRAGASGIDPALQRGDQHGRSSSGIFVSSRYSGIRQGYGGGHAPTSFGSAIFRSDPAEGSLTAAARFRLGSASVSCVRRSANRADPASAPRKGPPRPATRRPGAGITEPCSAARARGRVAPGGGGAPRAHTRLSRMPCARARNSAGSSPSWATCSATKTIVSPATSRATILPVEPVSKK